MELEEAGRQNKRLNVIQKGIIYGENEHNTGSGQGQGSHIQMLSLLLCLDLMEISGPWVEMMLNNS